MKNLYKISLCFFISILLIACDREEENIGWMDGESNVALPEVTSITQGFFNLNDVNNAFVSFELDAVGDASSIEVLMNFDGGDFSSVATLSTFPTTVSVPLSDVATALGIDPNDLEPGDSFGAVFLTTVGTRVYESGTAISFSAACPSELDGTVNWEIMSSNWGSVGNTGSFDWEGDGAGNYTWGSYTFGFYQFNFGCCEQDRTSALFVNDTCTELTLAAADGFGCSWSMTVDDVSGPTLTVTLTAGCGGGVTTVAMTRADGEAWDITP